MCAFGLSCPLLVSCTVALVGIIYGRSPYSIGVSFLFRLTPFLRWTAASSENLLLSQFFLVHSALRGAFDELYV